MTKKLNGPINYLGNVGLCNSCFCLLLVEVGIPLVLVAFNLFFFWPIELIHLCPKKNVQLHFLRVLGVGVKPMGGGGIT